MAALKDYLDRNLKGYLGGVWYGYTVAPGDPLFRAASHNSGIDGEIST
jgi:hypothetical protein